MPKTTNTRKQRAEKLFERLQRGPSFSYFPGAEAPFNTDEASKQYRSWSESWILEELKELIPELREKKG